MLRRLFKSRHRLSHPDAAERRAAVLALDADEAGALTDELTRLLTGDSDVQVRLACVERLSDPAILEAMLDDGRIGQAVARRLLELRPARDAAPDADPRLVQAELLALPPEQAAARLDALENLDDLVELALKARGELRQRVLDHPRLRQSTALAALEKRSRDRDKRVNRHARRLLDERKRMQREARAHQARIEELAAALQRRDSAANAGRGADDEAARARQHELFRRLEEALDHYAELRSALAGFGDELPDLESSRFDPAALPRLEAPAAKAPAAKISAAEAPAAGTRAAGSSAAESAAADGGESGPADNGVSGAADAAGAAAPGGGDATSADPFQPLVEAFEALDRDLAGGAGFDALASRRQTLTEQWLTTADHRPPSEAQHQVFEAVSHRFRELADAVERLRTVQPPAVPDQPLPWPDAASKAPPDLWPAVDERRRMVHRLDKACRAVRWPDWAQAAPELQALQAAAARLHGELTRADTLLQQEIDALNAQIHSLRSAIDDGHLQEAQSLLAQARSRHDDLPGAATRKIGQSLGREAARLAELKDWQTFATSPKRESLLDAMTALAEHPLEPRKQADRIKQLRRDWQALGPIARASDGRLADRFNAAAERAFEPCRRYFAELAEQRQANLRERHGICDQLERYLAETDWARADMKAAEQIMRTAREAWRTFHPVDRNPGKTVEARFERLQGELHDRVKAEWDRNVATKQALVDEAERLAEDAATPVQDKVEAAKGLQRRWREVGITPRRPDQQLWRAFRASCDRIFAARDDARQAQDAAVIELEQHLDEQLAQFEAHLHGLTARDADPSALRDFMKRTTDVDRLPPPRRRPLADRRRGLADRFQALLNERDQLESRDRLAALERWDAAMTRAESEGAPVPPAPPVLDPDIVAARAPGDRAPVSLDELRRLTVRAEVAAGQESAADDQNLRMELQVQRLQAGLSGGTSPEESPLQMALAWCRLGPKDQTSAPLRERFFRALAALE